MLFGYNEKESAQIITTDTPRKKGISRMFEVIGRDAFSFWKAGALAILSSIPWLSGVVASTGSNHFLLLLVTSAVGGAIAGPQYCGLVDTILRSLRDEPGFWWHIYRTKWKCNARSSLWTGTVSGLVLGSLFFVLLHLDQVVLGPGLFMTFIIGTFVIVAFLLLLWIQLPLMELSLFSRAKNAVLLILISPVRCAGAAFCQILYGGLVWFFLPYSLAVFLFAGVWLPCLLGMFLIYRPIEQNFQLEEKIRNTQSKE